jgi:pyruvate dehydrogenase E2 component (dihydrolipoamide acetyltransferase)
MPFEIRLPALSAGMEDAIISRWRKAEGDTVTKGEIIAEIETDKATIELEAEADGQIGRLLILNGARVEVNQVIAVMLRRGEDVSGNTTILAVHPPVPTPAQSNLVAVTDDQAGAQPSPVVGNPASGEMRLKASPLARRLARENNISLEDVTGTGPMGRIVRADIEKVVLLKITTAAAVVPPEVEMSTQKVTPKSVPSGIGAYEAVPHSSMRQTIARRLLEAKTTVPHFYLTLDCELDAMLALRGQINASRENAFRISINDLVIKAAAVALREVPDANVIWTEEALLKLGSVDIAVAVATDGGLITPIIRNADQMSISAISSLMKSLAARARENRLKPEEFQGGGFSISNLGMFGIKSFSAIINPPQSAILAVGAAERRAIERDGALVLATMMSFTLSVDHRAVDGAIGARWLAAFRAVIENPMSLLV